MSLCLEYKKAGIEFPTMDWKKTLSSNTSNESIVFILLATSLSIIGNKLLTSSGLFQKTVKGKKTKTEYLYALIHKMLASKCKINRLKGRESRKFSRKV